MARIMPTWHDPCQLARMVRENRTTGWVTVAAAQWEVHMSDEVTGSVEIAVVEFPGSKFTGEIAPALAELVNDGIVTIIDLVFVTREEDGTVASVELADIEEEIADAFAGVEGEVTGLLSDEDLQA